MRDPIHPTDSHFPLRGWGGGRGGENRKANCRKNNGPHSGHASAGKTAETDLAPAALLQPGAPSGLHPTADASPHSSPPPGWRRGCCHPAPSRWAPRPPRPAPAPSAPTCGASLHAVAPEPPAATAPGCPSGSSAPLTLRQALAASGHRPGSVPRQTLPRFRPPPSPPRGSAATAALSASGPCPCPSVARPGCWRRRRRGGWRGPRGEVRAPGAAAGLGQPVAPGRAGSGRAVDGGGGGRQRSLRCVRFSPQLAQARRRQRRPG